MKVVFHVDEMAKWPEATANIRNLQKAVCKADIVLSVNGVAVKSYLDPELPALQLEHVELHACHNALRANQIDPADLPEKVIVVPAGVLDLVQLQHAGYAYIKP